MNDYSKPFRFETIAEQHEREAKQRIDTTRTTFEAESVKFAKNPSAFAWAALKLAMYRFQEAYHRRPERVLADLADSELNK